MVIPGALHPRNRQPSVSQCIVFPPAFHPNTAIHIYTFIHTLFTESFYPLGTYSSPFKWYICAGTYGERQNEKWQDEQNILFFMFDLCEEEKQKSEEKFNPFS